MLLNHRNLKLLWVLRNVAIIGQSAAILIVTLFLDIPLPQSSLWGIIVILVLANIFTRWRITKATRISNFEIFTQLLIDIVALADMLYFTGGASNPFASLFILQVVIAAIALSPIYTCITATLAMSIYTLLMFFKVDMPHLHHHTSDFFSLHIQGMWLSFIILATIITAFVVKINSIIRRQNELLIGAEKMAAVGTLATSVAHELGTPLATMMLLAEDCKSKEIVVQIKRCKEILSRVTTMSGVVRGESGVSMKLDKFLKEISDQWKAENASVGFEADIKEGANVSIVAEQNFEQAIMNLLNNARDSSPSFVKLEAKWDTQNLEIKIYDKGAGMVDEVKASVGEVGFTTKHEGLGLGIFLAKSVVDRLDGTLEFINETDGMTAIVTIPIKKIAI